MSKRGAVGQGGEERYGGYSDQGGPDRMEEAPRQATAAQMAKRKIASLKGRPKARSASPMVNSNTFNAPDVSFGGSNAFNFGGQQQQQAPAFGGGNTSFTFGQSQPQQNGGNTPTFQFGQSPQSTPEPSNPFSGFGQQQQAPSMPNGAAQSNPFAGFGQQPQQPQQNATAPSNPFNFGQQQPAQPQQNGTGSSSTFTFGQQAQQPQQNGTAPSNPFAGFGQQNNAASSNTFTFGQNQSSQPARQNGTSSNIFGGFGQQKAQEAQTNGTPAPSNPFANFGQSQSTQPAVNGTSQTPSFGGFGQSQSQQSGTPAPSTAPTDADMSKKPSDTQKAPDNLFQPATTPSLFSKPADTPQPDSSNLFSSAGNQSIFSKPAETPKPASSNLFPPSASSTLFGSKPAETPKPASSNLFSSAGNQSLFSKPAETPKPASSNLFTSAASLSTADKPAEAPKMDGWAAFKSGSPSATTNGNAAAASGGDSVFSGWQKEQATKSFTPFTASQAAQPGDDEDEETTQNPEKPEQSAFSGASTLFGGPAATPKPAAGGDLFSRINKPDVQESAPSAGSTTPAAPAPGRSLFDRVSFPDKSHDQPRVSQTPASQASNLFSGFKPQAPPATVPPKNLFQPSQNLFGAPATPTPAASGSSEAPRPPQSSSLTKSTAPAPSQRSAAADSGNIDPISTQVRKLNEGLLAHLNKSSVQADYTEVCEYYIAQVKRIKGEPTTTQRSEPPVQKSALTPPSASSTNIFGAASSAKPQPQPQPANQFGSKRSLDEDSTAESPQKRQAVNNSTNLFQSAQQTPKATSALARPPATEPSKLFGKRPAEDEAEYDAPGKRRRSNEAIEYPKLPENASNTAKLFEAALKKPAASSTSAPAAQKSPAKPAADAPGGFKPMMPTPSASSDGTKPSAPAGGFKPSMPTPSASAGGFKPSAPAGGSNNFLAAFGQNAQKEQADARKKARDEDFDSEDDDPEEWERNYAAEQERKRAKIADAAKAGSGFTFAAPAASSSASSVFGGFGVKSPAKPADKEPEKTPATPAAAKPSEAPTPGSLFSKSTFNPSTSLSTFGAKPTDTEKDKDEQGNKTSADEDHTWKQGTPIKFGGASDSTTPAVPATAPPKGNSLFNNTAGSSLFSGAGSKPAFSFSSSTNGAAPTGGSSLFNVSKPAAPSAGFSFSPAKPAESAAEKPAAEAEKPDEGGDDDAAPAEPQVEDMTALQPSELEEADVLYHVEKSKCYKLEAKNEGGAKAWTEKGLGKIWLLKNKETGKTRVLLKVAPFGKPAMNFGLRADEKYEISAKKVMGGFIDHIHEKTPKAPSRWYVAFGREEDAKEMARIMQEEAAK